MLPYFELFYCLDSVRLHPPHSSEIDLIEGYKGTPWC